MDRDAMRQGMQQFVDAIGERFSGDTLEKTPERVAKAWTEDLLSGYASDPREAISWSEAPAGGGLVLVRNVRFASICVHHLLPFFGHAHLAYVPNQRLAGLSKLPRVLDGYARRLQTQERLGAQVVEALQETLECRGVMAVLHASHTCMSLRGVRKESGRMTTVATSGHFASDAAARAEVLNLVGPDEGNV